MPRKTYDPKVKAAFMDAAREARAAGKSWAEAFDAAKNAGYTGSLGGLGQMFLAAAGKIPRAGKIWRALGAAQE